VDHSFKLIGNFDEGVLRLNQAMTASLSNLIYFDFFKKPLRHKDLVVGISSPQFRQQALLIHHIKIYLISVS
jgi:hypothetical protein